MEITLNKGLQYTHISEATDNVVDYINKRRKKHTFGLRTRWKKLNNILNGGFEPHTLTTIAGISGSGKSSFANNLETDLFDCNPDVDLVVLNFSLEMLERSQVGRKLSAKLNKTMYEIYSGRENDTLTDDDFEKIQVEAEQIKKYKIYYVSKAGTVEETKNTIVNFLNEPFVKGKWVVIFLDHVLFVKGKSNESERQIISELQYMFVEIKKQYKVSIIQLSQLNRNIENPERITNPSLHFPNRSDLSTSDSLFQCSDYCLIIHKPSVLQIREYGLEKWPTQNLIYIHMVKARDGELKILCFEDNLKYNKLEEYDPYKELVTKS